MAVRTLEEIEAENAQLRTKLEPDSTKMKHMAFSGVVKALGERQVEVVISTNGEDRDKDIVEPGGIGLKHYNKNPVVLFQHDSRRPVARTVLLNIGKDAVVARAQFPDAGVSTGADEVYGYIKAEMVNAASIGFIPKVWEPRNKEIPWAGQHFKEVELIEWSFVTIPANPDALIIGRSLGQEVGKFFSWAEGEGLCFGQVEQVGEKEIHLQIWKMVEGAYIPTEEKKCFPAEQAAVELAPFKGFAAPEQKPEETACADAEEKRKSAMARLRAVNALRLQTNGF